MKKESLGVSGVGLLRSVLSGGACKRRSRKAKKEDKAFMLEEEEDEELYSTRKEDAEGEFGC